MKKFTTLFFALTATAFMAQTNKHVSKSVELNNVSDLQQRSNAAACGTLQNFSPSSSLMVQLAAISGGCPTGGYVTGNNCYGETEKATAYAASLYSAVISPSLSSCYVFFYRSGNVGTTGTATNSIDLKLYSGNMASGPSPTSPIATCSASIGAITALFSGSNNVAAYQYVFNNPPALPTNGFLCSVALPTTLGDTAVIAHKQAPTTNSAWEKNPNYPPYWFTIKNGWGGTTNYELAMFPVVSCASMTNIKENEMENFFTIFPNPSQGVFSIIPGIEGIEYELNVCDLAGRNVFATKGNKGIAQADLHLEAKGIYFVNIKSVNSNITKKVIIN